LDDHSVKLSGAKQGCVAGIDESAFDCDRARLEHGEQVSIVGS
jgi:hypothetical protein